MLTRQGTELCWRYLYRKQSSEVAMLPEKSGQEKENKVHVCFGLGGEESSVRFQSYWSSTHG